jgi:hypothetical protein
LVAFRRHPTCRSIPRRKATSLLCGWSGLAHR